MNRKRALVGVAASTGALVTVTGAVMAAAQVSVAQPVAPEDRAVVAAGTVRASGVPPVPTVTDLPSIPPVAAAPSPPPTTPTSGESGVVPDPDAGTRQTQSSVSATTAANTAAAEAGGVAKSVTAGRWEGRAVWAVTVKRSDGSLLVASVDRASGVIVAWDVTRAATTEPVPAVTKPTKQPKPDTTTGASGATSGTWSDDDHDDDHEDREDHDDDREDHDGDDD